MGLIIKATEEKKIVISGTEIELPSVYGRIEFAGRADGKILEANLSTYASKTAYKGGATPITTTVQQGVGQFELSEGTEQSTSTAHAYLTSYFEEAGFIIELDL
jgi:hypothetical protein